MAEHQTLSWRTSTACANESCVAVAFLEDAILVRHTKDPTGPVLAFTHAEWGAFLAGARNGDFDPRPR